MVRVAAKLGANVTIDEQLFPNLKPHADLFNICRMNLTRKFGINCTT
ncbi:unnamed protein product, partial [Heterotrigona itama]